MKLELIPDEDPRLHKRCDVINPRKSPEEIGSLDAFILSMFCLMKEHNGVGLAAPQVGITYRLFIMYDPYTKEEFICFNPKVLKEYPEKHTGEEGCLSYPGKKLMVARSTRVRGTYLDERGIKRTKTFKDLMARCFLHELDHLNGVVFLERAIGVDQ
jgi:peptide deformylase